MINYHDFVRELGSNDLDVGKLIETQYYLVISPSISFHLLVEGDLLFDHGLFYDQHVNLYITLAIRGGYQSYLIRYERNRPWILSNCFFHFETIDYTVYKQKC